MFREVTPNKEGIIEGKISLQNKVNATYYSNILFIISSLHFVSLFQKSISQV